MVEVLRRNALETLAHRFRERPTRHLRGASEHIHAKGCRVIKGIWTAVQGDPAFMRRVNGWLTIFWIAMIPVSLATGWVNSVIYVSALSLWALVSGHWSAWQAARVEVRQDNDADVAEVLQAVREIRAELVDLRATPTPAGSTHQPL
jgi:hypothetical protein